MRNTYIIITLVAIAGAYAAATELKSIEPWSGLTDGNIPLTGNIIGLDALIHVETVRATTGEFDNISGGTGGLVDPIVANDATIQRATITNATITDVLRFQFSGSRVLVEFNAQ